MAGFPAVEIIRKGKELDFEKNGEFFGPFPSGDTCIVADVAAKLGRKCCFLGTIGNDAFGRLVLERLRKDGVDVSRVRLVNGVYTGAVFVRYDNQGKREYIDYLSNSASDKINIEDIDITAIENSLWVHFSGEVLCGCLNNERYAAMKKLLEAIPRRTKVCFDPNMTIEIRDNLEKLQPFINRADLILPSENEAAFLTGDISDERACRSMAQQGKIVALKRGKEGCDIYYGKEKIAIKSYKIKEIDATGCGDSFCAAFMTGLINGYTLEETGKFACAAGAIQATVMGPMEGIKNLEDVKAFIKRQGGI